MKTTLYSQTKCQCYILICLPFRHLLLLKVTMRTRNFDILILNVNDTKSISLTTTALQLATDIS